MDPLPPLISLLPPEGFHPKTEVSGCYLEIGETILLLERALKALEGGTWGVPAGKIEPGESPKEAAIRELFEETGIQVQPDRVHPVGTLYIRKQCWDYTYHMFAVCLEDRPIITLNAEHTNALWANMAQIQHLPLISGGEEVLKLYKDLKKNCF